MSRYLPSILKSREIHSYRPLVHSAHSTNCATTPNPTNANIPIISPLDLPPRAPSDFFPVAVGLALVVVVVGSTVVVEFTNVVVGVGVGGLLVNRLAYAGIIVCAPSLPAPAKGSFSAAPSVSMASHGGYATPEQFATQT
jgi:hypothetical protein